MLVLPRWAFYSVIFFPPRLQHCFCFLSPFFIGPPFPTMRSFCGTLLVLFRKPLPVATFHFIPTAPFCKVRPQRSRKVAPLTCKSKSPPFFPPGKPFFQINGGVFPPVGVYRTLPKFFLSAVLIGDNFPWKILLSFLISQDEVIPVPPPVLSSLTLCPPYGPVPCF